jgi:hypothetical protein
MQVDLTELEGAEVQPYRQAVLTSQEYQNFKQRVQQQFAGVLTLRDDSVEVIAVSIGQDKAVLARIPIEGGAGNSGFVAAFPPDATGINETRSALFTEVQGGNIAAITELNGKVELDAIVTPTGTIQKGTLTRNGQKIALDNLTEEQVLSLAEVAAQRGRWGCMKKCLGDFGYTGWVLTVLGIACSIACATGPACLSCIYAGAVITAAHGARCVGRCF